MRPGILALPVLLAVGVAMLLVPAGALAGGATLDAGGNPRQQLVAGIESSGDILQSGGSLPLRVRVVDQFGLPVAGATVSFVANGGRVTPATAVTDESGLARATFTASVERAQEFTVHVEIEFPEAIPDRIEFAVVVIPPPPQRSILTRPETVSAGIGAAMLALLASTEFGRYGLFNLVVFPLYSRLKREEVLDHFVRGQIYGYVMSHPGEHYNSLRETLKVKNGTLAHHLRTLEVQGFVKSERDGIYKRFYPIEVQVPRDRGIRLSDLQHHILALIREDGGPTQGEIASRLEVSQQTVSYNLRHLSREGLVRMEREGRAKRYFLPAD